MTEQNNQIYDETAQPRTWFATLRLTRQYGRTGLLGLVILITLVAGLEWAARQPFVASRIPTVIGSSHLLLDAKFGDLDYLRIQEGEIDCIFMGSSVVYRSIDPAIIEAEYRAQTGAEITCYNFGVQGITAAPAGALAEVLVQDYQPKLLVFGFMPRALAEKNTGMQIVLSSPWIRYKLGNSSLEGWLIDHSLAYRRYLALRGWTSPDFVSPIGDLDALSHTGFGPFTDVDPDPPMPTYLTDYPTWPYHWAGLEQIAALDWANGGSTQVLLVEMPLPPTLIAQYPDGPANHANFVASIHEFAAAHHVPYWESTALDMIPADGWHDNVHLKQNGAAIFSAWLGEQIGRAVVQGDLVFGAK
ncbi:MAG: hypothetical protein JXA10_19610 [Anaerolineae bacterium]|nr:hypothetical protein [Anaerolineae bacterium]